MGQLVEQVSEFIMAVSYQRMDIIIIIMKRKFAAHI